MATPIAPISLLDIQTEFGGSGVIGMNEYYAGAGLVPNPAPTSIYQQAGLGQSSQLIPTGGVISIGNFRGVNKIIIDFFDDGSQSAGWYKAPYQGYSD